MSATTVSATAAVPQGSRADRLDVWLFQVAAAAELVLEWHRWQVSTNSNACPRQCIDKKACDLFTLAVTVLKRLRSDQEHDEVHVHVHDAAYGGYAKRSDTTVPFIRFDYPLKRLLDRCRDNQTDNTVSLEVVV